MSRKDMILGQKDIARATLAAQYFPRHIGVDFCTQGEYPPLQYEGDAHLAHYWFECHSGAVLSRLLCLRHADPPPFGRLFRHILFSFQG